MVEKEGEEKEEQEVYLLQVKQITTKTKKKKISKINGCALKPSTYGREAQLSVIFAGVSELSKLLTLVSSL